MNSGYRFEETMEAEYEVEGVLLPRPFKITKIGPVDIFVKDLYLSVDFSPIRDFGVLELGSWHTEIPDRREVW